MVLQLPEEAFSVGQESPKLRVPSGNYRIPDVCAVPIPIVQRQRRERPTELEVYGDPMPLVIEVWSPSTDDYDVDVKLQDYQRRGDQEIWRIHPYERTLTAWRRQPDGSYIETVYQRGAVQPASLPGLSTELAGLFD